MRVIAGSAGGIQLNVPSRGVRPTMDRVKEAIFSSLGEAVIGARVLDLFAGSGALGIEALSRGATSVLFVDEDRQSTMAIEKNLAKTKFRARVTGQDVFKFLKRYSSTENFGIIFADPPYEQTKSRTRTPTSCCRMRPWRNCSSRMGSSFWKSVLPKRFLL